MKKTTINFLKQPGPEEISREGRTAVATFIGAPLRSSYELPGVEYAPNAIRRISERYSNYSGPAYPVHVYNPERGYILEGIPIEDAGDAKFAKGASLGERADAIERMVKRALDAGKFPIVVGGDHYSALPAVSAYGGKKLTVVHLDAHGDYLPEDSECPHGYVMRGVASLPGVERIVHAGLRGNLNTGPGLEDSAKRGNAIITASELKRRGAEPILRELSEGEAVHVSFDVDFWDPSIAPAVGVPEPGGISYDTTLELFEGLFRKCNVLGLDITEYNPKLEGGEITGIHATNLAMEALGMRFRGKK